MPDELKNQDSDENILIERYRKFTTEMVDDFIKLCSLNWSTRNDFAKAIITVSSGILAALATFSSNYFKSVPSPLVFATMVFLFFTVCLNVVSLWLLIESTLVPQHFLKQMPIFLERVKKMNNKGVVDEDLFDDVVLQPIARASKYDDRAYVWLKLGIVSFFISILLLLSDGVMAIPAFISCDNDSIHRSLNSSPQSFAHITSGGGGAKFLNK
jgi:hypothetical protein